MGLGYCTMKQDYITNRIYKNLQYPVLGWLRLNQAGYFILSLSIKGRVERDCLNPQSILSVLLARFGLIEYNVARMGNKQSYALLRKLNRGLYHTS